MDIASAIALTESREKATNLTEFEQTGPRANTVDAIGRDTTASGSQHSTCSRLLIVASQCRKRSSKKREAYVVRGRSPLTSSRRSTNNRREPGITSENTLTIDASWDSKDPRTETQRISKTPFVANETTHQTNPTTPQLFLSLVMSRQTC